MREVNHLPKSIPFGGGFRLNFKTMQIERLLFHEQPEKIAQEKFDCIWISFASRDVPSALKSPALQWLDWKLQGQISRFLLDEKNELTTVLPTMRKVPTPYLVLEKYRPTNWTVFAQNCEGLKASRVLYFCEESTHLGEMERAVRAHSFSHYPESIMLGSDS